MFYLHEPTTTDLGLAAALCCAGYRINRIERSNPRRVIFRFEVKEGIEEVIRTYWDGTLQLSAIQLFTHQKLLKQRIYGQSS